MVVTTRLKLDRISSSTRNAHLGTEVIVGDQIVAAEGYVLAVRILEDKSTYNTIEDTGGRMVVAPGRRRARGHAGYPARAARLRRRRAAARSPSATRSRSSTSAGSSAGARR